MCRDEAPAPAEDDGEEDAPDDDFDALADRELQLRVLRETIELKEAVRMGNAGKHELKRVLNRSACGICSSAGAMLACMTCRVRLCRDTMCWNLHINEGKGNMLSESKELKVDPDQGDTKQCPARDRPQGGDD